MVSKLVIFTLFVALWQADFISSSGPCNKKRDVMVVVELTNGNSESAIEARQFLQEMKSKLNPSPHCTKLGFIFVWKKAQVVIPIGCDYRRCYRDGLTDVNRLNRFFQRMSTRVNKKTLLAGIKVATDQLYSEREGARMKAEKVLVLVLSNPPMKSVISTSDEMKDYHDMRIKVIAVGVGEGKKENLAEIVVQDHLKFEYNSFEDLVSAGVKSITGNILNELPKIGRIAFSESRALGSARGPPGFSGPVMSSERVAQLKKDRENTCRNIVDIAFIMDSSGSVRKYYIDEKYFVQRIASRFEIIEAGSHGGVILFSSHGYIKTLIKFTDFLTTASFNQAVGNLPYYGYMTRIDTALKLAHTELYTSEGKTRPNVHKLLFLITDGRQNPDFENGKRLDPAREAEKLHLSGVQIYAVGIGSKVNITELALITKDKNKVYSATDFKELVSDAFVSKVSKQLCEGAAKLPTPTATVKPVTIPAAPIKKCNQTNKCGCGCGCCEQKSPVYINIFRGANSKNYLMQGAHVSQSGGSNSLGSLGFREISSVPSGNSTALSEMDSKELANLIQKLMPFQQQFSAGLKEMLRRALAKETKRRRRDVNQANKK